MSKKALLPITKNDLGRSNASFSLITSEDEYSQNYILYRVNLPPIKVPKRIRDFIERAMAAGKRFVRVGEHTVMVNSIAGIDPLPRKLPKDENEIVTPDGKFAFNKITKQKRRLTCGED